MNPLKKLAGETAIYGVSSIVGRFLNWLLVPLYTYIFHPAEFGIVAYLLSYVALFLVLLTFGMETGYFRFANKEGKADITFTTGFLSLIASSLIFWILVLIFLNPLSAHMNISDHKEYILLLAATLGLDAITALPFAKLRLQNRAFRYAGLKLINIFTNLGINLFFLVLCPWIHKNFPGVPIEKIWNPNIGVGYIFIAFCAASVVNFVLLLPDFKSVKFRMDWSLLKEILSYSWPILIVSICGQINLNLDKMLMPDLIPASKDPMYQTGIYAANYKLAVIMTLFIQAFRYAFEPFFFSQAKQENSKQVYADVLKYFTLFCLLIFLGVMFYIDIVKLLIKSNYHEGLSIVPYVLLANLFFGVFFSLSLWYKLSDKTRYGAIMAIIGSVITIILNIILVPRIGYQGAAYAVFICFAIMMIVSYLLGQKYYPVPYDIKRILFYFVFAMFLFAIATQIKIENQWLKMLAKTPLLLAFIGLVIQQEKLWEPIKRTLKLK
ncbi:polysaccharide biosynthesis C-terminal domain-containing protein [Marinifilum caeruleilacunae]|uniref:Polysaccharide biosynthesis protein n=1 Tax=Marinifilum caeruleilacunae TaxID=2499076 RepID=A0ABX1WUN3_9BACT|nr:oligosaccharide flippase family protein [Marinifilum caeruleilacunae]NOU59814.1 polysaccharide biosynthesis protein [Marinifilum caeruleilacunae]